jgi:hypothetical protein
MNLHPPYNTEEEYYKPIEDLVGQTIDYCSMQCKVVQIAKYVKPKDFHLVGFRCLYVLQIINPTISELEAFEEGYLYANSDNIMYSYGIF